MQVKIETNIEFYNSSTACLLVNDLYVVYFLELKYTIIAVEANVDVSGDRLPRLDETEVRSDAIPQSPSRVLTLVGVCLARPSDPNNALYINGSYTDRSDTLFVLTCGSILALSNSFIFSIPSIFVSYLSDLFGSRSVTTKRSMPLPRLPVEVWRQIFSLTIREPGALLADRVDPFTERRERDAYWTQKLPARSTLLLVCKEWHCIAIEIIHEYIHLGSSKQVAAIANRLERSKMQDGHRALGNVTRRIDSRMHNPMARDARNIARILRCTPNLEIYVNANFYMTLAPHMQSIHPVTQTPSEVVGALLSTSARSLRRVEWTCNESPSWDDLMDLLRESRGLQSLTLANIYGSFPNKPRTEHLILPSLKTFILGDSPSFSHASLGNVPLNTLLTMLSESSDQLPCLQRLEGFSPFSPDFLRTHGHKIRIVQTVAYTPLLPEIIAKCPNLETFITIFPHQLLDPLSHPSLKRIGIFPISEDRVGVPAQVFNAYIMKPLEDLMNQIEESHLPNLAQVRIKNIGTLAGVADYPVFLQKWWNHWNAKGVRFDDRDGQPFKMSTSATSNHTIASGAVL